MTKLLISYQLLSSLCYYQESGFNNYYLYLYYFFVTTKYGRKKFDQFISEAYKFYNLTI